MHKSPAFNGDKTIDFQHVETYYNCKKFCQRNKIVFSFPKLN